jgi:hypothetical protein
MRLLENFSLETLFIFLNKKIRWGICIGSPRSGDTHGGAGTRRLMKIGNVGPKGCPQIDKSSMSA